MSYQPKTGARCTCKPGQHRDNCPQCEGTGWQIDFRAIHDARHLQAANTEAKNMKDLIKALKSADASLEQGDPEEAVSKMDLALLLPMSDDDRRTLNQARAETNSGSPEKAESLLGCMTFRFPTMAEIRRTPKR